MDLHSPVTASALETAQFDYVLPVEQIAQEPLGIRDASRLLHCAQGGLLADHRFTDLPGLLRPGDLLVANTTRVRSARLRGTHDHRRVELLVLEEDGQATYACLVRPARHLPPGTRVIIDDRLSAVIGERLTGHSSGRRVTFTATDGDVGRAIERCGEAPLPPYIKRPLQSRERYQTTYAAGEPQSAAAPTAGLHFTDTVRQNLADRGVGWTTVDLQVGLATFAPMRAERIDDHPMHRERVIVPASTVATIQATRAAGGRVIAVGTTSMRAVESAALEEGGLRPFQGETDLFIRPGFRFRVVDGLITNFHQPRSSLLVLLTAFMGDGWRGAYDHALRQGYRFLSFGDCMLCWNSE